MSRAFSRRGVLRIASAAGAMAAWPGVAAARPALDERAQRPLTGRTLVDPYTGSIPLTLPLAERTYIDPVRDNWHGDRQGDVYPWTHRLSPTTRAHDGVDIYPAPDGPLPPVFAPFDGIVVAVCIRPANRLDAPVLYAVSGAAPPPWDYSRAIDPVAELPLYGNFVWLRSTAPDSAGYLVLFAHLQDEPVLRSLRPDQAVTVDTPLGIMGDTGNAEGTPQLHVELHYPDEFGYRCRRCNPPTLLTSFNAFASLTAASRRPAPTGV